MKPYYKAYWPVLLKPLGCEDGGRIQEGQTPPTICSISAHFQLTETRSHLIIRQLR
jgi:hypothetical protein